MTTKIETGIAKVMTMDDRVKDLEKTVALLMASLPIWIGYEEVDSRFLEDWYKRVHDMYNISTKGIRD